MKKHILKSLLFVALCGISGFSAYSAPSLFSDYGQIQNVQNYSSNPFWNPNSPYNQRLPQPVYVNGTDVKTEDCMQLIQSLVSVQCMARNNCKDTSLSEVRPEIMVQLSKLPGNNYVSSCSGYIDSIFESYVAQYGNALPTYNVNFPNATVPNQNINNPGIQIQNPYKQVIPKSQQEILDRQNELQQLQKQNGAGSEHLSANAFPTTFDDLSFSEKMAVKAEGYAPYAGKSAYVIPNFQTASEWCNGNGKGSIECEEIACKKIVGAKWENQLCSCIDPEKEIKNGRCEKPNQVSNDNNNDDNGNKAKITTVTTTVVDVPEEHLFDITD